MAVWHEGAEHAHSLNLPPAPQVPGREPRVLFLPCRVASISCSAPQAPATPSPAMPAGAHAPLTPGLCPGPFPLPGTPFSGSPRGSSSLPKTFFPASLCPYSPLPSTIHGAPAHLSSCASTSDVFDLQGHQSLPCPGMSASWNLTPSVHCSFHNAWNSARFIVYAQLIFVD